MSAASRENYRLLKSLGICTVCGRERAEKNRTMCWACLRYMAEARAMTRARHLDRHECTYCGKPLPEGETRQACDACREKYWKRRQRKSAAEAANA